MAERSVAGNNTPGPMSNNRDPERKLDEKEFISEIQIRPVIWNQINEDNKKYAKAWKSVCRATWHEFERWSPDIKRKRCLELQNDWKKLKLSFANEYNKRQKNKKGEQLPPTLLKNYDGLTFLIPTIEQKQDLTKQELAQPTKKLVTNPPTERCSCCCENEDKKFLLSLVSLMADVPKESKLALRANILNSIAQYTPSKKI